ncbi:hypothetical protein BDV96DRAFT_325534 [Lophiotrema nucula]|uniref:Integral membrane protein-like protein n=1 Tax=Lophiotrema nucula TaxID=690887 RepID=A0A6A5YHR2_9PLEO|nr:hypothetical protein BDV96DRAFT_325534 [Lophiotrema nucula]
MVEWGKARTAASVALLSILVQTAQAHEHHMDKIEEGHAISDDPIDSILWTHILIQVLAWGILFPTGMVLGIIRSKWHVPVQTTGSVLAVIGYFLGHKHKGRQFAPNIHSKFVPAIMLMLIVQVALGVYLKLHLERGINGKIRRYVVVGHGVIGKALPIVTWVQFLFGGITAMGFCRADHTGQCLAHFIMGSAFIAYGILLTILLLVGQLWIRRTGRSQEFFDSLVIAAWGCVNTFTEHRWGGPWAHNDLQHTSMGIVWWCAGLVGIWLSRKRDGRPKRNLIPGIVILLTGYAMSAHPQSLPLSTMVHSVFGYTLMAAGLTRIIEIAFVLRDRNATSDDGSDPNSFQYLTPFLLYASGFLFMGATEEQMQLLSDANVTHVSYVLILYSIAFLLFLFVNMLLHLYAVHAWGENIKSDAEAPRANGHFPNGHARTNSRIRDAEEFELEGLITDDEDGDAETPVEGKARRPLAA